MGVVCICWLLFLLATLDATFIESRFDETIRVSLVLKYSNGIFPVNIFLFAATKNVFCTKCVSVSIFNDRSVCVVSVSVRVFHILLAIVDSFQIFRVSHFDDSFAASE